MPKFLITNCLEGTKKPILILQEDQKEIFIPTLGTLSRLPEDVKDTSTTVELQYLKSDKGYSFEADLGSLQRFSQQELIFRELNVSKGASEILASKLKEMNLLYIGSDITFYSKIRELLFLSQDNDLIFCTDIRGLLKIRFTHTRRMTTIYRQYRSSLKCVLLHNGNKFGSILIGHSTSNNIISPENKKCPGISTEKLKTGIFHVPQIRQTR